MPGRQPTDFEQVLLSMIAAAPSTGYDLKHEFATTPMGLHQPSSGALYPALHRLQRRGLVRAEPSQPVSGARSRRRYIYHITEEGLAAHNAWVRRPVDPAAVGHDLALHLMRFVMMERLLPRAEVLAFLADLRDALAATLDEVERYAQATAFADRHSPLAIDHGISTFTASLAWTKRTINALAREPADGAGPARTPPEPGGRPRRDHLAH